ncbi:hypothetical protein N7530_001542 [Penicillium desertorum]|uniref:Uncharacterized protein n=1 Tax=Penicillium desertorum TaxID=1303715 RepID=A0A9W9XAB4_9EURO|nr:hypothetical protein N7530_001542 [Penicillium desertorum]
MTPPYDPSIFKAAVSVPDCRVQRYHVVSNDNPHRQPDKLPQCTFSLVSGVHIPCNGFQWALVGCSKWFEDS